MEKYEPQTIVILFQEVKQELKEIKEQTQKTNGRVSSLERWRSYITGGLAVIVILLIPILISVVVSRIEKTSQVSAQTK